MGMSRRAVAILLFSTLPLVSYAGRHQKAERAFRDKISASLHDSHSVLIAAHTQFETNPQFSVIYAESELAYTHAIHDLEDYESGDTSITQERLTNDATEVFFDLAPIREQMRSGNMAPLLSGTRPDANK